MQLPAAAGAPAQRLRPAVPSPGGRRGTMMGGEAGARGLGALVGAGPGGAAVHAALRLRPAAPGLPGSRAPAAGLSRCHVRPPRRGAGPGTRPAGGAERAERRRLLPAACSPPPPPPGRAPEPSPPLCAAPLCARSATPASARCGSGRAGNRAAPETGGGAPGAWAPGSPPRARRCEGGS